MTISESDRLKHKRDHESGEEATFGFRPILLDSPEVDAANYTIKQVTVATNRPVARDFGEEKIVITEDSIRNWEQFKAVGIPFTAYHETEDRPLGRIKNPTVSEGILKADVVFDRNNPEAMDCFNSVTQQGLTYDLSITYLINAYESERMGESMSQSRTVTDVTIFDVSYVGVPADSECGFGRSATIPKERVTNPTDDDLSINEMTKESPKVTPDEATENVTQEPAKEVSTRSARASIKPYREMAKTYGIDAGEAMEAFENGVSIDEFKDQVMADLHKRASKMKPLKVGGFADNKPAHETNGEYRDGNQTLSLRGAVCAAYKLHSGRKDWTGEESLALDVSQDLSGARSSSKVTMPLGLMVSKRTYQAGGATTGAPTIQTTVYNDRFIDFLYNNTISGRLGIQTEMGLTGNSSTPRLKTVFEADATQENAATASQDVALDMVPMTPHPLVAHTKLSDLAQIQSPGSQSTLSTALMRIMQLKIDNLTFGGGGTNEPNGIGATGSINTALTGTKQARAKGLADVREMLAEIEDANVPGEVQIVTTPFYVNYLRSFIATSNNNTYLWTPNQDISSYQKSPGFLWGAQVWKSTNIKKFPGNTSGNHVLIAGDFSECVQGFWGSEMEFEVTPVGDDRLRRQRTLITSAYMDVAVRHDQAFKSYSNLSSDSKPTGTNRDVAT